MDYEFKNKNTNVKREIKEVKKEEFIIKDEIVKTYKSKKPLYVWSNPVQKNFYDFESMLKNFLDESKE